VAIEKQTYRESFDKISNGGPGIETLLTIVFSEGVTKDRLTIERMVDVLSTTPARLFGLNGKGAIEVGKDADVVIFDPTERRTVTAAELHHTSDYTPYEGLAVTGGVVSTIVRGQFVVRDGHFVGKRGYGRFQERRLAWRD
jgi:dihydropyrimidinase